MFFHGINYNLFLIWIKGLFKIKKNKTLNIKAWLSRYSIFFLVAADLGITRGLKSSFLLKEPKTSDETEDLGALVLLFLTMTYSIISSSSSDELYSGF